MKVAVPSWKNWISPVLDEANNFMVYEIKDGRRFNESGVNLKGKTFLEKISYLKGYEIDTILCGAVSNNYFNAVSSKGIRIIPWLRGDVNEVVDAFISNGLKQDRFIMPGCRRCRKRRRKGGNNNR